MNVSGSRSSMSARTMRRAERRRGNTIVLVTGILVLLVIIATAYITRTQAGRTTSASEQRRNLREDTVRVIAESIADEIQTALFVHPLVADNQQLGMAPNPLPVYDSNKVRYPPPPASFRYSRDVNFPYNCPPYNVIPWTNWPDPAFPPPPSDPKLPKGPANRSGGNFGTLLRNEGNPYGGPGYGDTRWLRDIEPLRWCTNTLIDFPVVNGPDAYSHYRHLTNLSRPENTWRIIYGIDDVGDSNGDGIGKILTNLNVPVEQWLTAPPYNRKPGTGNSLYDSNLMLRFRNWMGVDSGVAQYENAYVFNPPGQNFIPSNFYHLRDLNGDYVYPENGQRVQDEFIPGTIRWNVGRVLADTDGDGYTDAFWETAPTPIENGIRQIVAVSIIDNCAMLDVNVATRGMRNDLGNPINTWKKTAGLNPADLALVGELNTGVSAGGQPLSSNWNIGFLDNPSHGFYPNNSPEARFRFGYDVGKWPDFLSEVGLPVPGVGIFLPTGLQRLDYWRRSGSASEPQPASPYTPFGIEDEIELRMYAGSNYPWIFSRFEHAVQDQQPLAPPAGHDLMRFLRSGLSIEENSELLDQHFNRELVADKRHMLTMYSNANNEFMPPWLWRTLIAPERKIDLRRHDINMDGKCLGDDDNGDGIPDGIGDPGDDGDLAELRLDQMVLRDTIARALMDTQQGTIPLPTNAYTYYGKNPADVTRTKELAAAYAANILAFRDNDAPPPSNPGAIINPSPIVESIAPDTGAIPPTTRFMGMEAQPFLLEAYLGHIYRAITIPTTGPGSHDLQNDPYTNAGHNVFVEDPARRSTIVVVQIANPFNRAVDLALYELKVFGQVVRLADGTTPAAQRYLRPATDEVPTTAVYYAIKPGALPDDAAPPTLEMKWLDFLDLDVNLPTGTIVQNVSTMGPTPWTASNRDLYDAYTDDAITLARVDTSGAVAASVVIDRFDLVNEPPSATDRIFGNAVNEMVNDKPPVVADPPGTYDVPPGGGPYGGTENVIDVSDASYTHWVQWVRTTRCWGIDVNANGVYNQNEKSPRFVFGDHVIVKPAGLDPALGGTFTRNGNVYKFADDPDADPAPGNPSQVPWFTRDYMLPNGTVAAPPRQPTFFNMNRDMSTIPNYPDKGWYSQGTSVDTSPLNNMSLSFPMQMLQKDDDFEQVGELLNVWLYGHKIDAPTDAATGLPIYNKTVTTFSEYMTDKVTNVPVGRDVRVNRLRMQPSDLSYPPNGTFDAGFVVGIADETNPGDPRHSIPRLPAGVRLMDAFVCDGSRDVLVDFNNDGVIDQADKDLRILRGLGNAKGFDGTPTPGMINLNTAFPEVMQALPHWYRAVHESGGPDPDPANNTGSPYFTAGDQPVVTTGNDPAAILPRVMLPEALWQYREQFNGSPVNTPAPSGIVGGAGYERRKTLFSTNFDHWLHIDRGLDSIGEIMLLTKSGNSDLIRDTIAGDPTAPRDHILSEFWRCDMGVTIPQAPERKPFRDGPGAAGAPVSMWLSTDRQGVYDPVNSPAPPANPVMRPDTVAGDVEEANMLFAGASNMITTRSDTFTVYFRIRSFRQNTSVSPPVWDATNPEYIVDDSRYVMLVDRSMVMRPGDKAKIIYLEKLPN